MKSLHNFLINNHVKHIYIPETGIAHMKISHKEFMHTMKDLFEAYDKIDTIKSDEQKQKAYDAFEKGITNIFNRKDCKIIKQFLKAKGDDHMYIDFTDGTILQIVKGTDETGIISINVLITHDYDYTWGDETEWKHSIVLPNMYNVSHTPMDYLYFLFIKYLYEKLPEK